MPGPDSAGQAHNALRVDDCPCGRTRATTLYRAHFDRAVRPLPPSTTMFSAWPPGVATKKLLSQAQCLLFQVQWEEPFGMVMIEAMVCGTPVAALCGRAVCESRGGGDLA